MNCDEFAFLLDTLESNWTREEREGMEAHAKACPECAKLLLIRREMRAMDQKEEVPEAFSASWRAAIRREEKREMNKKRNTWKRALATAAAVAFVVGGTALSYVNGWGLGTPANNKSAQTEYGVAESYDYDSGAGNYVMMSKAGTDTSAAKARGIQNEKKIIRTVDFTLKTKRYDADFAAIQALVEEVGGRVESLNVSGEGTAEDLRYAHLTLRIPTEKLEAFVSGVDAVGTVSAYSESSTDVSETYYDLQARLDVQLKKMERLQELLGQAQTTSDLIELESAIGDTQYMIDTYTGQLNNYDSRIDDSYVYVTLREMSAADAADDKALGFFARVKNALQASVGIAGDLLQSFAVFALTVLPWCAALAVIVLAVRGAVKLVRRKK